MATDNSAPANDTAWRDALASSLRGADPERVITQHYPDAVVLSRLQSPDTRKHAAPGHGDRRRGLREAHDTWLIGQRWDIDKTATRTSALEAELHAGVQALHCVGTASSPSDITALVNTVGRAASIDLDGNLNTLEAVFAASPNTCVNANVDPFAQSLDSGLTVDLVPSMAPLLRTYRESDTALGHRLFACNGARYHASGASDTVELALMYSTLVAWLRATERHGLSAAECAALTVLCPAVGSDTVLNVAKLRALRIGVAAIFSHCGDDTAVDHIRVHAQPARREHALTGPWVNALRSTAATVAAALAGVDAFFTHTHDNTDDPVSRRLARNTQLILRDESGLDHVQDPAGGSGQFEQLTESLLERAWSRFQAIEADGGIAVAINQGHIANTLKAQAAALLHNVEQRKTVLTGVNLFPDPHGAESLDGVPEPVSDLAVAPIRLSSAFDALRARAHGKAHRAQLVRLSRSSLTSARSTFSKNLLAAGGIATCDGPAPIAILCGSDDDYTQPDAALLAKLTEQGTTRILLAGASDDAVSAWTALGATGTFRAGLDAAAFLNDLLNHLEAA